MAIRFLPGGAFRFLGNPMSDFTDQIVPLEAVSGRKGYNLAEQLTSGNTVEDNIVLLEKYLTELLSAGYRSDVAAEGALNAIIRNNGNIRVSELAKGSGCSERQLRRKFDRWVGVAPKVFCRIIRFQHVLQMLRRGSAHNSLFAALDSGYHDQSHFIHEFNSCYGLNPSQFVNITNL
jgi:AraC-like DNA-binding protein